MPSIKIESCNSFYEISKEDVKHRVYLTASEYQLHHYPF